MRTNEQNLIGHQDEELLNVCGALYNSFHAKDAATAVSA